MDTTQALLAFQALSQDTRLKAFRLLIKSGPEGMAAGDIALSCDVLQNTMSAHLSSLTQAGLIQSERDGRSIRYTANIKGIQALLGFLMQDCCGGDPTLCPPFPNASLSEMDQDS